MVHSLAWRCVVPLLGLGAPANAQHAPVRGWAHDRGLIDLGPSARGPLDHAAAQAGIADTFARWDMAYDEKQAGALAALFVPDARFRVLRSDGTVIAEVIGRDRIVANVLYAIGRQGDQRRHLISNVVVNAQGCDRARASAYGLVLVVETTPRIDGTVVYGASLRRGKDSRWRFTSLTVGLETYGGTPPPQLP